MTTIGRTIAAARENAGYTLADLSARTCIRTPVLAGIEADDFRGCGGDFYARGHIRAVCRELGIDPAEPVEQFDREHAHERSVPAFTGKPVTRGTHAEAEQSRPEDAQHSGSSEGENPGAAEPRADHGARIPRQARGADQGRRDDVPTSGQNPQDRHGGGSVPAPQAAGPYRAAESAPASGPGRSEQPGTDGGRGAEDTPQRTRRGKHGRPDGRNRGAWAREQGRDEDRRRTRASRTDRREGGKGGKDGEGKQSGGGDRAPAPRRVRKPNFLSATIDAARRSWPLVVVAAITGAAVVAAAVSWPQGRSQQGADAGPVFQREAPAAATAPALRNEPAPESRPSPQAAPSHGSGLSAVTSSQRKADEVRLNVTATDRVWLRVTDAQGDNRFTGVMKKGDARDWSHPDGLRLHVAKGSAVRVTVNGEDRGAPATSASVARITYSATDLV